MTPEKYMLRAIELAEKGLESVSPNPMVGCVIVHKDQIIGEGYHQKYGTAHAEVNAINSVRNQALLNSSRAYVTLEPCIHFGKTPPCSDLLIKHGLSKIVIGTKDPFEKINGKGIATLREAGVKVEVGLLETACRWTNRRFFTFHEKKRPYIILKWAQTSDSYIARTDFSSKWISNVFSRQLVHKWRAEEDAILVGKNTVKYDDPYLTVREWEGSNPIRIVIDRQLELSEKLNVFDRSVKTLVFNEKKNEQNENLEYVRFDGSLKNLLEYLYIKKIQSLIVEGGKSILKSFIETEMWDEARIFSTKNEFGEGISAPDISGQLLVDHKETGDRLEIYANIS